MSNHLVEILFHSGRGSVCLEPSGSRHGQVAVPMTSNLKAVQNGQHSSPISLVWSEKSCVEVN
jgi:hypothetical protein